MISSGRRKILVDPHIHSEGSYDSDESVENIVEHVNDSEIDAAVITDHDTIEKSLEAVELSSDYDEAIFVPGVEVSTKDGHLLAIGVTECPEKGKPFMKSVREIRELGGIAVVPHPFQVSRHGVSKSKIIDCDAIEIYNSSWTFTSIQNRRAERFAKRNGYPGVAGSDAHSVEMIGQAYTEIEIETRFLHRNIKPSDIPPAMKGGFTRVEGKRAAVRNTFSSYMEHSARKAKLKGSKTQKSLISVVESLF